MGHGVIGNLVARGIPLLDEGKVRVDCLSEPSGLDRTTVGVGMRSHQRTGHRDSGGLNGIVKCEREELRDSLGVHSLWRC